MAGAIVCKHCRSDIGTPKRPAGVTAISALSFLDVAGWLFTCIAPIPMTPLFTLLVLMDNNGVELMVGRIESLILAAISLYCGLGFLKQRASARRVYLGFGVYRVGFQLIATMALISRNVSPELIAPSLIGFVIFGWILYYVMRRRDYFPN